MLQYWKYIRNSTVFKLGVTAAVSFVLYQLSAYLFPVLLAIGLAFALYPLSVLFEKVTVGHGTIKISRVIAIILAFVAFGVFMFITIGFIILPLFGQINELLVKMPAITSKTNASNFELFLQSGTMPQLPSSFGMLLDDAMGWAMSFIGTMMRNLLESTMDIIKNLVGLIVVPFLAFYFLKDWRELRRMIINLFSYDVQDRAAQVIDEIGRTLSAYIQGLGKLSLIAGFCITIGTAILGLEFPLVLGFLAILAETVPVVGPMMGAVPAIFISYGQSSGDAFHVALFYLVFYQLDANFIMPKVMGKKINLHPVLLILSLLIGAKLFGILGMLFAVPVAAVYRVLYNELWHSDSEREKEA